MTMTFVALPARANTPAVHVSINERTFSIPWGQELEVPDEVVEILKRGRYPVLVGEALEARLED
jgi:hypothetical protein